MHYQRWRKYGNPTVGAKIPKITDPCIVSGCGRKHSSRGYCQTHARRLRLYGDPLKTQLHPLSFSRMDELRESLLSNRKETDGGCWDWTGNSFDEYGYGVRYVDHRRYGVHRLSAFLFLGFDIKSPLRILHSCDRPSCFFPGHLRPGTPADNSKDMVIRGRSPRGEKQGLSKLTEKDVGEIKSALLAGARQKDLAKKYKVSRSAIHHIRRGSTWTHMNPDLILKSPRILVRDAIITALKDCGTVRTGEQLFADIASRGVSSNLQNVYSHLSRMIRNPSCPIIKVRRGYYQYQEKP